MSEPMNQQLPCPNPEYPNKRRYDHVCCSECWKLLPADWRERIDRQSGSKQEWVAVVGSFFMPKQEA